VQNVERPPATPINHAMDFAIAIKLGNAASGAPATTGMKCGKDVEKTTNGEATGAIARPTGGAPKALKRGAPMNPTAMRNAAAINPKFVRSGWVGRRTKRGGAAPADATALSYAYAARTSPQRSQKDPLRWRAPPSDKGHKA
jgi:hypothetical protein